MIRKPSSDKRQITSEQALSRLAALCAASEQCSDDLTAKLKRWGFTQRAAARVLKNLEENGFLCDERFARAYAHDKMFFNGWGRHKISRGLYAKRIPEEAIRNALDALDHAEYCRKAYSVIASRAAGLAHDRSNREKLLRFAAGRGYEASLALKIINRIWDSAEP